MFSILREGSGAFWTRGGELLHLGCKRPLRRVQLALTVMLASAAGHSQTRASDTITMGVIGTGSAQHWALWIADAKVFFAENNLRVETAPSAAAVMQQIIAGSIQIGTAGLTSPMRAIDQGIPVGHSLSCQLFTSQNHLNRARLKSL
jgi:hypothetical protein